MRIFHNSYEYTHNVACSWKIPSVYVTEIEDTVIVYEHTLTFVNTL